MNEKPINHALHIVLAILTGGLWLIPYLFILLARSGQRAQSYSRQAEIQRINALALHQAGITSKRAPVE